MCAVSGKSLQSDHFGGRSCRSMSSRSTSSYKNGPSCEKVAGLPYGGCKSSQEYASQKVAGLNHSPSKKFLLKVSVKGPLPKTWACSALRCLCEKHFKVLSPALHLWINVPDLNINQRRCWAKNLAINNVDQNQVHDGYMNYEARLFVHNLIKNPTKLFHC